ncbi:MAG: efflux RND transporter periplasmic adaptor subunit [Planctomycetaceae bacterium]|nr:efflux RND transporter periplasmic adaptor subunit [Planctomycetaceae bacterium]
MIDRRICIIGFVAVCAGCEEPIDYEPEGPTPVTVQTLSETRPTSRRDYTGSLGFWNHENLAFEVAGRVIRVARAGDEVSGPFRNPDGTERTPGAELAAIDATPYEFQLSAAQARYDAMNGKLDVLKLEIADVEDKHDAAKTGLATAQKASEDAIRAYQSGKIGSIDRDKAIGARETAEQLVDQTTKGLGLKRAELRAAEAQLEELEVGLRKARTDLKNCVLRAPFSGTVAQLHITNGSVVAPGRPAATLVMMDPLRIEVTVSADSDRELHIGDVVEVRPANSDFSAEWESETGWVHAKATAANPATRTLSVTLLVRNRRVSDVDIPDDDSSLRIREFVALQALEHDSSTSFIPISALYGNEQDGYFTWRIAGLQREDLKSDYDHRRTLERVAVTPGARRIDLPGGILLRELTESPGLDAEDLLAVDVPAQHAADDPVWLAQQRWMFRPGGLVSVRFSAQIGSPGYYVPLHAIVEDRGKLAVFRVNDNDQAERIAVTRPETFRDLVRIESPDLEAGDRIVARGAQLLSPGGESVRVITDSPIAGADR